MDRFDDIKCDLSRSDVQAILDQTNTNETTWVTLEIQNDDCTKMLGFDLAQVDRVGDEDFVSTTDVLPVLCAHETARGIQLVLADKSTILLDQVVTNVQAVVENVKMAA